LNWQYLSIKSENDDISYQKLITLQSSIKSSLETQIPVEVEQFTR